MTSTVTGASPTLPPAPAPTLETTSTTSGPAAARRSAYLHHLDFVRGSTFMLVILCHVLSNTNDETHGVITNALEMGGHFTRNSFFFLTGFVLMYGNNAKGDFSVRRFWARRLRLVAIPYLIWSVVYWAFGVVQQQGWSGLPFSLGALRDGLLWGTAGFHLYFIFVIMQFYLLFPLILWIVRATRGHHGPLLALSFAVQISVLAVLMNVSPPADSWLAHNWWHAYSTFLPYQFFVFAGAVVAVHQDRVRALVQGRSWWIVITLVASAVFALVTYVHRINAGQLPVDAAFALQPTLQPFVACAIVALYATAVHWSDRRQRTPRTNRIVTYASNRSFAIFLSHVFVLQLLIYPRRPGSDVPGWFEQHLGSPWSTMVVYVLTVAATLIVAEILRRAPGALYLTGRPRLTRRHEYLTA